MMAELTTRQERFAEHYVRTGNASQAARDAGYAAIGARVTACRLLTNPNVQAAVRRRQRAYERDLAQSREQVIAEIEAAIDLARTQGDVRAMIAGWREIGRLCGFYDQSAETKIHVNIAAKREIARMEMMSDSELVAMIEADES